MFDLAGKTALVTGAGQTVGAGIAQALAGQGARVLVNDVIAERAQSTVDEINADSGTASCVVFDGNGMGLSARGRRANHTRRSVGRLFGGP